MLKRPALIFSVLIAVYAAVRLWRLTDSCLWFDEIFSVHAAEHGFKDIFYFLAQDLIHPPLFYLLLKLWISAGGDSLLWLRLFPLVFAILAVIPFLLLCRELKLRTATSALSLGLVAVNGALIKYAQEVRMYSLLMFLSLASIWLFSRFFYKGKSFAALCVCNVLLVYTHYFGWLVVLAEVALILVHQRIKARQVLLMSGIAAAAFVPWIIAVYRAAAAGSELGQNIGWISRPGITASMDVLFDLIEPLYFQASSNEPTTLFYVTVPLLLVIFAAGFIYLAGFTANIRGPEEATNLRFVISFIAVPIVVAFIVSWASPYSVWGSRHLIIVFAPTALLIGIFVTEQPRAWLAYAAAAATLLIVSISLIPRISSNTPEYAWCSWEKVAAELKMREEAPVIEVSPDPVYAFEDLSAYHLWFALREHPEFEVLKVEGVDGVSEDTAYFLPRGFDGVRRIRIGEVPKRFSYAAFRDTHFHPGHPPVPALGERGLEVLMNRSFRSTGTETVLLEMR